MIKEKLTEYLKLHKSFKIFLFVFPVFFLILFLVTFGLFDGYFEQDEWLGIASAMSSFNLPWWDPFIARSTHFSPLGILFWRNLYNTFHLQANYYFLIELIIHASVSTLVFILSLNLTKSKKVALLTSLLFLLNSRAHQAFTHLAIFHVTTTSMFFIMLFVIYLTGIKSKYFSFKNVLIMITIFFTAISFREEGYIIAPLFVSYIIFLDRFKINKKNIKYFALLIIGLFLGLFARYYSQVLNTQPVPIQYQITGDGSTYNLLTVPIKLVVQNLIYSERIVQFFINYHQKILPGMISNVYMDLAPYMDMAFVFIFIFLLFVFMFWLWIFKQSKVLSLILFLTSWIFFHAVMLSFVGRPLNVLEPRYLYFSSFPVFLILSIILVSIFSSKSRNSSINIIKKSIIIFVIGLLFLTSFQEIRNAINKVSYSGIAKKKVLSNLVITHPKLSKNSIIYIKCKSDCYRNNEFGISTENVLPFSSGPGLNILITYASLSGDGEEWAPFLTEDFLFPYLKQGYKKNADRSFGYFVDKAQLEETLSKQNISPNIVIALEYNEENFTFRDISKEFRETISKK